MQVKGRHDKPLYYAWLIGSSEVSRIQIDPRSVLSYALQGHATFEDPYPPIKCHSDNHLRLQQWYAPDGKNQAQMSNWRPEIRGDIMSLTSTPRTICCWDDLGSTATPSSHPLFIK